MGEIEIHDESDDEVEAEPPAVDPATDASWREALERAGREKKPILLFEKPAKCKAQRRCADFEDKLLKHPGVQRRLAEIVFVTRPLFGPPEMQISDLVLHDRRGKPVARLGGLPADNTVFAAMLDGIVSAKPNLENAAALAETKGPHEGELELATALYILGRGDEGRAAIERASLHGSASTREMAIVALAMLDSNGPKRSEALQSLQTLAANASNTEAAATAWMGIATIHRSAGATDEATQAYRKAIELAPRGSGTRASASEALASLQPAAAAPQSTPIRIIPPQEQIVTGPQRILTSVSSTHVARVVFTVDGDQKAAVDRPPFSTSVDFGRIPQAKTIRAVAFNVKGKEIGRHELTVNHAGDMFWLRLIEPRAGKASGNVRVTTTMRAPAGRNVKRVVVSWNDAERAVITREPWQADVRIPTELGILKAVAELDDGRTTEDAVLLNTTGYVEQSNVLLVELPVTITDDGAPVRLTTKDVTVREGRMKRAIESVISGSDAPLTVGLVFDTSGSMYKNLLDVQEAAIRFLDTALGPNDRAFLITFDTTARLIQTPTSDRALLRNKIMALRTQGDTALYDAMILGLLQFEGIKGRRAMIVFSDGDDRVSRYETKHVEDLARRSNIPIYLIAAPPTARPFANAPTRAAGPNSRDGFTVQSVAGDSWSINFAGFVNVIRSTGGNTHSLRNLTELPEVYEKIAAALRAQSLVVIRTDPGRSENDWRTIDVDVAGRGREVRAPAGYYAPW